MVHLFLKPTKDYEIIQKENRTRVINLEPSPETVTTYILAPFFEKFEWNSWQLFFVEAIQTTQKTSYFDISDIPRFKQHTPKHNKKNNQYHPKNLCDYK